MSTPETKPNTTAPATGLDSLAKEAEQGLTAPPAPGTPGAPDPAAEAEAAQQQAVLEQGIQKVLLGLLKVARTVIAKHIPEIRDEWPDDVLEAPAAAAVPLARKYMATLMEVAGRNPELAGFVVACFPLGMGLYTAYEKAQVRLAKERPAGEPAAAAPPDGQLE